MTGASWNHSQARGWLYAAAIRCIVFGMIMPFESALPDIRSPPTGSGARMAILARPFWGLLLFLGLYQFGSDRVTFCLKGIAQGLFDEVNQDADKDRDERPSEQDEPDRPQLDGHGERSIVGDGAAEQRRSDGVGEPARPDAHQGMALEHRQPGAPDHGPVSHRSARELFA